MITASMHKISTVKAIRISRVAKPFLYLLPINSAFIVYYYVGRFNAVRNMNSCVSCIPGKTLKNDRRRGEGDYHIGIGRNSIYSSFGGALAALENNIIGRN